MMENYRVPAKLFGSTEANRLKVWKVEIEWLQVGLLLPVAIFIWGFISLTSFLDMGGFISQVRWLVVGVVAAVLGYFVFGEVQGRSGPGWAYLAIMYYIVNKDKHMATSREVTATRLVGIRVKPRSNLTADAGAQQAVSATSLASEG